MILIYYNIPIYMFCTCKETTLYLTFQLNVYYAAKYISVAIVKWSLLEFIAHLSAHWKTIKQSSKKITKKTTKNTTTKKSKKLKNLLEKKISNNHFYSQKNCIVLKIFIFLLKNIYILLVFPIEEISPRPELSSPPRFTIQGGPLSVTKF